MTTFADTSRPARLRDIAVPLSALPPTAVLGRQRRDGDMIMLTCRRTGDTVAPTFQFRGGQAQRSLLDVWSLIVRGTPEPWDAAIWMERPNPDLAYLSPADYAHMGGRTSALLALARPVFPWPRDGIRTLAAV